MGHWNHGALVENLGTIIAKLGSFSVVQLRDTAGGRDHPRVGAKDASHIGPDGDLVGVYGARDEGRGVVGAPAAQCGGSTIGCDPAEAGDDRDLT